MDTYYGSGDKTCKLKIRRLEVFRVQLEVAPPSRFDLEARLSGCLGLMDRDLDG